MSDKSQAEFTRAYGDVIGQMVEDGLSEETQKFAGCLISELEGYSVMDEETINEILENVLANLEVAKQ